METTSITGITKLLIANRAEIAVRIIRACRDMGIFTIAVYSEADRHAPHVALADEAVLIGPSESASSYLSTDAIITAAKRSGADAIHPGYGFLSESEALIGVCEQEGIIFIGPHREAIRLMGSKIESKKLAQHVGVATIPGYHGNDQSDSALRAAGDIIGYPLMIKASAGGGGRGIRCVNDAEQLLAELPRARQEALSGFGDGDVLLEKFIARPRHIEVQLAADKLGNMVHLFERECSIQRNHQKIVEEAPAAFLDQALKTQLYRDAITLGRAIAYDSLGTVEFLVDDDTGKAYFLEMNTRLQVEHPVTEAVTGQDLVRWQIDIAAGKPLPCTQDQLKLGGWAIEARLNAEDAADNYCPQTGAITLYREPLGNNIRVDSGVNEGSVITSYYDPMLAKIIGWGTDREAARRTLLQGLGDFLLAGPVSNLEFLSYIVSHENFSARALTTNYLSEILSKGWQQSPGTDGLLISAAIARVMVEQRIASHQHASPWRTLSGFRLLNRAGYPGQSRIMLRSPGGNIETVTVSGNQGLYQVAIENINNAVVKNTRQVRARWLEDNKLLVEIDGLSQRFNVNFQGPWIILRRAGNTYVYQHLDEQYQSIGGGVVASSGADTVSATLPGQIVEVPVVVGAQVSIGDTLIVLDSMKLLHQLKAQTNGTVVEIFCAAGDSVESGAVLVALKPTE